MSLRMRRLLHGSDLLIHLLLLLLLLLELLHGLLHGLLLLRI
jgi:hypothetical protein